MAAEPPGQEESPEREKGAHRHRRSQHARKRAREGRPIRLAMSDAQRAGKSDVFIQVADGRFIVRGTAGREHVFSADGNEIITSVTRSHAAHLARLRAGTLRPATDEEVRVLKEAASG